MNFNQFSKHTKHSNDHMNSKSCSAYLKKDKPRFTGSVTRATVDSGACTTIAPPHAFPHTHMYSTNKVGKVYGACGGEAVKNIGNKLVHFKTDNDITLTIEFEIGDKITKPLIAVSDECSRGHAVFFGPGPKFESMIIHDPDAFCCFEGKSIPIKLRNGTYEIDIREQNKQKLEALGDNSDSDEDGSGDGHASAPVELVPDSAPEPVISHNLPEVQSDVVSKPLRDNRVSYENAVDDPYQIEPVEGVAVKVLRAPFAPTPSDIEKHNASMHLPYRSWCPICVWGRGKEKGHFKQGVSESDMPYFSCDYCFLTTKESTADNLQNNEKLNVFVIKEHKSRIRFMSVVPQKALTLQDSLCNSSTIYRRTRLQKCAYNN